MGVPSLVGAVLTLTGGTYLSWGYLPLLGGGYLHWSGGCIFLGDLRKYFSSEGVVVLSNIKISQVVKKMSSCQKDVKCQKVKHMDYGGSSQKKINWHNEVHTY